MSFLIYATLLGRDAGSGEVQNVRLLFAQNPTMVIEQILSSQEFQPVLQ